MNLKRKIAQIFYLFELIQQQNIHPKTYWGLYLFVMVQAFCSIEINGLTVIFSSSNNPLSVWSYLQETVVFGYFMSCMIIQSLLLISLIIINSQFRDKQSNFFKFCVKLLFYVSLLNYTVNFNIVHDFSEKQYKIIGVIFCTISIFLNLAIMNFTFSCKRIWPINQLLIFDLLRIEILWTNGSYKILQIIVLIAFLVFSTCMTFFRPIFHLTSQNKFVQFIFAISFYLSIFICSKILTESYGFKNIIYEVVFGFSSIIVIYLWLEKWLHFKISKVLFSHEEGQHASKFNLNHFLMLEYLEQNFQQYQSQVKIYIIKHTKNCKFFFSCPCKSIVNCLCSQLKPEQTNDRTKFTEKDRVKHIEAKQLFRSLFTEFILFQINLFEQNQYQQNYSDQVTYQDDTFKKVKKEVSIAKRKSLIQQHIFLKFLKLSKLINDCKNLNLAYISLTSLKLQLKTFDILSSQNMGILNFLKAQIVEKKSIALESAEANVNKFCIKYFHSQKVTNKLQEVILKAVNEAKQFWKEVRIKEPDTHKILSIMSRFNKHHDKVMEIYSQVEHDKERQTMEVRMLFKFYERILQLEGNARFFKDAPLTDDKVNDLKNANALNLKLYSDESNTQVMSFSINEEDFGKIRYRSSSFQSLIDPSFVNINDFLLQDCVSSHNRAVKRFLEEDNNYYKHTETSPCYIRVSDKVIKPVYLEVHLMSFFLTNEIQQIVFLKPLIEDSKLISKGTCKNFQNDIQQNMVVLVSQTGQFKAWTKSFQLQKDRIFEGLDIDTVINQSLLNDLSEKECVNLQLADSDYEISLIKKIPIQNQSEVNREEKYLYGLYFEDIIENKFSAPQKSQRSERSLNNQTLKKKRKGGLNIKTLLIKTLDNELQQVEKYDQKRQNVNLIYSIASRPQKQGLQRKWRKYFVFFAFILLGFIIATTIVLSNRKEEFLKFNNFATAFANNQVAMAQAITYLRETNIHLYNNNTKKIPQIPSIMAQVQRLNEIIYDRVLKLSQYLNSVWMCMDILDYGPRIMRKEKAFLVLNNFVLTTITNILQNMKSNPNALKFNPIQGQIRVPYSQTQASFLKLINNAVNFVVPSSMQLREYTLNNLFLPNIRQITDKVFFYLPIAGLITCCLLVIYFVLVERKVNNLYNETFDIFSKLNHQFVESKLSKIQKNERSIQNKDILKRCNTISLSKKLIWKNFSQIFQKTSSMPLGTLIINSMTCNSQKTDIFPKKQSSNENEDTQRQLIDNEFDSNLKSQDKSFNSSNNENFSSYKNDEKQIQKPKKEAKLVFGCRNLEKKSCYVKFKSLWIAIPIILYFSHIFLISVEFNRFIETVLYLKNYLEYRKQSFTYIWHYQYEVGLYESFFPIAASTLTGLDEMYKTQRQADFWAQKTEKFIFGKLSNYNQAYNVFFNGNVCENLHLISNPQPFFGSNYSKEECMKLSDGVLQTGFHQAQISFLEVFRAFIMENMMPQFYPPIKRFMYLNDSRIQMFNKMYPYLYQISEYASQALDKDFNFFIRAYEIFIILDAPLMIFLCFTSIGKYIRSCRHAIKKELSTIKCCFLLIGHKNFLTEMTLLNNHDSSDQGQRYHFLQ